MDARSGRLSAASPYHLAFISLTNTTTFLPALNVLWTIARFFFFPQFQTRFFPKFRPVIKVDHELDASIPFEAEHVDLYLSFIPLWMKSCDQLYRLRGRRALPAMRDYLLMIARLYREASTVYLTCQTTTERPHYYQGRFALIHASDPHFHCVPSLHVMIVAYNYWWMRRLYGEWNLNRAEDAQDLAWLYEQALSISESVLLVKQHSINCIPAALFMLKALDSSIPTDEILHFINQLFTILGSSLINKAKIRQFIYEKFLYLLDLHNSGLGYCEVVLQFIEEIRLNSMGIGSIAAVV